MLETYIEKALAVRPSARQLNWQKLEFIGFIHYGINTYYDQEWGNGRENPQAFLPTDLDASQWAKTAKSAGMKGIILTCKHHDGFCLWPSAFTSHSVKASPWKNGKGDVVKELAQACQQEDLKLGIYLSPWDRNHPSYGQGQAYDDYFCHQLTELLTQYGPIFEVWFDGANGEGPNGQVQHYDWDRYFALIRQLQPDAVIAIMGPDVRWVGNEAGKVRPSEWSVLPDSYANPHYTATHSQQSIDQTMQDFMDLTRLDIGSREALNAYPGPFIWYPAETDVSIRPGWFYHAHEDQAVKSAHTLFDLYLSSVGGNSVLLLNLPVNPAGRIPEPDVHHLYSLGQLINSFQQSLTPLNLADATWSSQLLIANQAGDLTENPNGLLNLTWSFQSSQKIVSIVIKEDLSMGQRIESGRVSLYQKHEEVARQSFTTVGYQKIIRLDEAIVCDQITVSFHAYRGHQLYLEGVAYQKG